MISETSLDLLPTCLLIMDFHFGAVLCCNLALTKNSNAGHIGGSHGLQVPHPSVT